MFGELSKLLGRDFAVGYFLPAVALLAASISLFGAFGVHPAWLDDWEKNLLVIATAAGLAAWLGGLLLVALNRSIVRFFEGYGSWNPLRIKTGFQVRGFNKLRAQIKRLDDLRDRYDEEHEDFPPKLEHKHRDLLRRLAERFPDREDLVLATAFGNTIRAFEVYPRALYGLDAVVGWSRLLAVIPKQFRSLIDSQKAQMDFWVNLWFSALLCLAEFLGVELYFGVAHRHWRGDLWWIPVATTLVLWLAILMARGAAEEWGDSIKSAFDVFLPKLRDQMEYAARATIADERQMWLRLSQAIVYRFPAILPERDERLREQDPAPATPAIPATPATDHEAEGSEHPGP